MANETETETTTPEATNEAAEVESTETPEIEAAEAAGEDAAVSDETTEASPEDGESAEAGEDAEAKSEDEDEPAPHAEESPEVAQARRMVAAASRKERKALDALKTARQYEEKARAFDEFISELRTNPLAAFQKAGFDTEAALKLIAEAPDPNDRVGQLERQLKRQEQERVQTEQIARIESAKAGVTNAIKTDERFDLVNAHEAYDEVWGVMLAYHQEHGVALDPAIAAAQVESVLEAKITRSKKFSRAEKAPSKDTKPTATKGSASAAKPKTTTLTNTGSGRAPKSANDLPVDINARHAAVLKQLEAEGLL
jgi:hypothetical protein